MKYELDLSKLTIDQMKAIISIVNGHCGDKDITNNIEFVGDCKFCEACELECWDRAEKEHREHLGVEIAMCG